jgi:hypothetical protein
VVVLHITILILVRVPIEATCTEADNAALNALGREFPNDDGTVATDTQDLSTGLTLPGILVGIATPVATYVILSGRVGDVIALVGAVYFVGYRTGNQTIVDRVAFLTRILLKGPRLVTQLCLGLVLTPTVVRAAAFFSTAYKCGQISGIA